MTIACDFVNLQTKPGSLFAVSLGSGWGAKRKHFSTVVAGRTWPDQINSHSYVFQSLGCTPTFIHTSILYKYLQKKLNIKYSCLLRWKYHAWCTIFSCLQLLKHTSSCRWKYSLCRKWVFICCTSFSEQNRGCLGSFLDYQNHVLLWVLHVMQHFQQKVSYSGKTWQARNLVK